MAIDVLGAGFGRTGTLSLKFALEKIGFHRCYHMLEVVENPAHVKVWRAANEGQPVDWDALFAGYRATVDWPACTFWRSLAEHYPKAKVLLTVRDPERWYDSVCATIYRAMTQPLPPGHPAAPQRGMARELILERTFGGRFEDRAHAIGVFERHNQAVRHGVPVERLLVYEAAEGWEPLCRFLGVAVPDEPFPRVNTTQEFRERFRIGDN